MKPSEVIREKANMSSMASFKPIPETWDWIMAICSYLDEQAETTLSEGIEHSEACKDDAHGPCLPRCPANASQKETHLKPTVQSFIKFCEDHPDYRLFQALQAWLKENGQRVEYIYLQKPHGPLEDAFYLDNIK